MAADPAGSLRIAFVSAPGTSIFMTELLVAVDDAVVRLGRAGVETIAHHGLVSEIVDERTVAVVVPHEYHVLAPVEPERLRLRMVAFGVEHPGTEEFESAAAYGVGLGARFEISQDSVEELARRGVAAEHFPLGYVPRWDRWQQRDVERTVDVAYLGTADPRRIALLAGAAPHLVGLRTELMIPPHEQMTGPRPDFLTGPDKWALLARSRVLVNLHRGSKGALEWVRVLEAMVNGCAVVTEPSDDLGPLRPGEHLLVAEPAEIGRVAASLARDDERRARMVAAAYHLCRNELDMAEPAARLVETCLRVLSEQTVAPAPAPAALVGTGHHHLAAWLPAPGGGGWAPPGLVPAPLQPRSAPNHDSRLAVLCTGLPPDGQVEVTTESVGAAAPGVPVHARRADATAHRGAVRNLVASMSDEPFLLVLDGGDRLLDDTVLRMADLLRADPALDAVLCPATYGDTLVNVLVPDERRLRERVYLTRGYVVRRATLEALGGFTEDPALADLVDHHFWLSLTAGGGRTGVVRQVGVSLVPAT